MDETLKLQNAERISQHIVVLAAQCYEISESRVKRSGKNLEMLRMDGGGVALITSTSIGKRHT